MKVTVLGCGASMGVPMIGCECSVCTSPNPKNKRSRASILVEYEDGFRVLVDTSPDLRAQALNNGIDKVDAIIFTHAHADHIHGIDDVRRFNVMKKGTIPAYATAETFARLQQSFAYIFAPYEESYYQRASLEPQIISAGEQIKLANGKVVLTFPQQHGKHEVLGLRFGDFAYSTDVNFIPESSYKFLKNMKIWMVDCLRDGHAGGHANLEMALGWIKQFKPEQGVLFHMNHELEYETLKASLPQNIEPAYDGMQFFIKN